MSGFLCFFGVSGEGYSMVELLGVYVAADIGSAIGIADGNRDVNIEGYILGQ